MEKTHVEAPLVFSVELRNLEGRIDVNFYKPGYKEVVDKLKKSPFELRRLGDIVALSDERWKKPSSGQFKYIEINDIDTYSAKIIQAKLLSVEDAPSRAQQLIRKDDIIVSTTRPYRGAIALVSEEFDQCVCSTGFAVLRNVKVALNRKYLLYFLHSKLGLTQMEQRMTGGNYPAITPQELLKIWVALPAIDIQERIISFMEEASNEKTEMEKEADNLLDPIDDYVLSELQISLPKYESKSPLEYEVDASLLKKNRWDVAYWKPKYTDVDAAIKKGRYEQVRFESLIGNIINGLDYRSFSEEGTQYLRVGNIKPFEIDDADIKRVPITLDEVTKDVLLEKGDILLTRKGTFGVATLVGKNTQYLISSEIFKIKLKSNKEISQFYIVTILNSSIGKEQFSRRSVGTIMGSLSQDAVKLISIPLPPMPVQDKIAKEVKARIEKAKELKKYAKITFEKAEKRIEKEILGGDKHENGLHGAY